MQNQASTKGFYGIVSTATGIGIIVVMVLNVATPLDFVIEHFYESLQRDRAIFGFQLIARQIFDASHDFPHADKFGAVTLPCHSGSVSVTSNVRPLWMRRNGIA